MLGDHAGVREAEFVQWGAEQGGEGDAQGREDDVLGREGAQGAFRRKSSAMFYCQTQNYPRRALCDEEPLGTGQAQTGDAGSP